ncbi:MAG: DUF3482 domain-containing protein [Acidobacteriota bacterium]
MSGPLRLGVVGHVNTGKTSLICTLARRDDLAVADGRTTRRRREVSFRLGGRPLLVLVDTPGFELAPQILEELDRVRRESSTRLDDRDALDRVLNEPALRESELYSLDLEALEAALACDLLLHVVDVTETPLEHLREELALLVRTTKPVIGVLNFAADPASRADEWREVYRREKVHAQVAFDVMVADAEAEAELFATLTTVLPPERRGALDDLQRARRVQARQRREESLRLIAAFLVEARTQRCDVGADVVDAERLVREELEETTRRREAELHRALGKAHGFAGDEVRSRAREAESEVLRDDLFSPDTWKRAAPGLLGLMAGGATAGVGVDVLLGGSSLGLGAILGGAVGLVSGLVRKTLDVQRRGDRLEAELTPDFALVLLARALAVVRAYEERTHARRDRVELGATEGGGLRGQELNRLRKLLGRIEPDDDEEDRRRVTSELESLLDEITE